MGLASGIRIGPYELVSPMGAGGMGEVYRARDTRLDRSVAIKVLPPALAADAQLRERFEREARAISSLRHPHICTLYDVGAASISSPHGADGSAVAHGDTIRFLGLELLEGETLEARLNHSGPLPLPEALRITLQVCDALDKAHAPGIVHRDLKPGNVFLERAGGSGSWSAKLLDFGLAKTASPVNPPLTASQPTTPATLTAQGTMLGTFQYMSPEQIEGLDADARSDIFAFGALLFEMLTGRPAFEGRTRAALIGAILKDHPPAAATNFRLPSADASGNVYVIDAESGESKRVTFERAQDFSPIWSPDGQRVVFVGAPAGAMTVPAALTQPQRRPDRPNDADALHVRAARGWHADGTVRRRFPPFAD